MEQTSTKPGRIADRGPSITIITSIMLGLTSVAVLLRCYVRIFIQEKFSSDDYVILFAYACFVGLAGLVLQDVKFDAGKHAIDILTVHPDHIHKVVEIWWIADGLFVLTTCGVKIAVSIFFCSLQPPRVLQWVAKGSAYLTVVTGLATWLFQVFECRPASYFWTRFAFNGAQGSCLSYYTVYVVYQTINSMDILTDVALATFPCIMVWNLQMKRIEKFYLSFLLGLGALPSVFAIIRAVHFNVLLDISDFTYTSYPVGMTSVVEPAVSIIAVCIARFRPLIRKIIPRSWLPKSPEGSAEEALTIGRIDRRPRAVQNMSLSAILNDDEELQLARDDICTPETENHPSTRSPEMECHPSMKLEFPKYQ